MLPSHVTLKLRAKYFLAGENPQQRYSKGSTFQGDSSEGGNKVVVFQNLFKK